MAQLKRFSNKAQLLRYISNETEKDIDELWSEYENQIK